MTYKHKDISGKVIAVGNSVATTKWIGHSRKTDSELVIAKVVGFTPQKIRLEYETINLKGEKEINKTTKFPNQVSLIEVKTIEDLLIELKELRDLVYSNWQVSKNSHTLSNYQILEKSIVAIEQIPLLKRMYGYKGDI